MRANNENGMTLVEILAALVILGIVFISFMTIFPQMNNFNNKTETKLVSMNLAKKELQEIKKDSSKLSEENKVEGTANLYKYSIGEKNQYECEVEYTETPDLNKNSSDKSVALNKIQISVKKDGKLISETFGYLVSE
ncbi:type IV pilus modification PilV family protein [Sporosarcina obsidiansis]|uniref:type IV pilus modification PilV family protein n=1 Tax=Sporosarcina obsidiansis TaxID=2660748 RepID=UPI00129B0D12|nr:type II secretion system protein [Sporosarcina obsidiansis]